jgi:ABC-type branched-subunit amino acid transport system substrate-binding protein
VDLTPEQRIGKQIYMRGFAASGGQMSAVLDEKGSAVSASILPCGGCHGRDGRGRREGAVSPSDITWDALTNPYDIKHEGGRKHPPYSNELLRRAIVMGIDPAGNPLQATMPRYKFEAADLANLIAYLHVLGTENDPGVGDAELRLGVVLPSGSGLMEMRAAIRGVLEAFERDVNDGGGIFERRLSIRFIEPPQPVSQRLTAIREFLGREEVFALIASAVAGAEEQVAALLAEHETPLIGAFALYPHTAPPLNRYVFYLLPGIADQGRALADFAAIRMTRRPVRAALITGPDDKLSSAAATLIEDHCHHLGWTVCERIPLDSPTPIVSRLEGKNVVFVLATGVTKRVFSEARALPQDLLYLVPGSLADFESSALSPELRNRVFLSYPALPSDSTPEGFTRYRHLFERSPAPRGHLAAQWTALTSAYLLMEALKRAGRDVTRERVIEVLESLYEFKTGLLPPATFGPNRRIGSFGVHIVSAADPVSYRWMEPK